MLLKKYGIKSKNISLMYFMEIISGMVFFLPFIALYLEQDLFNITNVAIIFGIEAIAFALFEIPTGAIADLFGRKRTIIFAHIVVIFAMIFLYLGGSMIMFITFAILNSLARSLYSGTDSALIYDTLKEEGKENYYKKIIGTYSAIWPLGAILGSIIGGYIAQISLPLTALLTIIPFSIALILTFFLKEPSYEKEDHRNVIKHMIESLKIVVGNKQLIILMLGGFILMAFSENLHRLGSLFFEFKEIPLAYFGYITALIFAGSSLGHYMSHYVSEKIGNKNTILISVVGSSVLIVLATFTFKYTSILLFIIPSLFFGLKNPVISHLLNLETDSKKRATIISTSSFMGMLGMAIFAPFIGYLAELYTINTAFKIGGILMFIVPIIFLFLKEKN
jgi:MFS family permease